MRRRDDTLDVLKTILHELSWQIPHGMGLRAVRQFWTVSTKRTDLSEFTCTDHGAFDVEEVASFDDEALDDMWGVGRKESAF